MKITIVLIHICRRAWGGIHGLRKSKNICDVINEEPRFLELVVEMFTLICRFIVMQNKVMKYMTRMGQKTGMLKNSKKVQKNAMTVAFVAEYQNLNSAKKLVNSLSFN